MQHRRLLSVATSRCGGSVPTLRMPKRFLEYWGIGVTGRTQRYAQGEAFASLDNMHNVCDKPSAAAASLTGNQCNIAYTTDNIFSVKDYSAVENHHYQPLRGVNTHRIDPIAAETAARISGLLAQLLSAPSAPTALRERWWSQLLTDFPSLATPCTPTFRTEWEVYMATATGVGHDDAAVKELAKPFLAKQREEHFISYGMVWRIAERLCDALDSVPGVQAHERRLARVVVERVIKLSLDTIADEPWAHSETTSPLNVDVSQFRAWHEAGYW